MVLLRLRLLSNEPRLARGLICVSWWGYFSRCWRVAECMRSLVNCAWSWAEEDSGSSTKVVIVLGDAVLAVVVVVVVVVVVDEATEIDEAEVGGMGQVCNSKLRGAAAAKLSSWVLSDLAPAPIAMVAVSVPEPSLPPRHGTDRERDLNKRRTGRSTSGAIMIYLNKQLAGYNINNNI